MEILDYLPSLGQLISQVNADIGNMQLYWIIAFASAMLVFHGIYIMLVVICFHKLMKANDDQHDINPMKYQHRTSKRNNPVKLHIANISIHLTNKLPKRR